MDGSFLIGARAVDTDETFEAYDPALGEQIAPGFSVSTSAHVAEACRLADAAFDTFREFEPDARATFLEAVAANIEALGDALVERAMQESGLVGPPSGGGGGGGGGGPRGGGPPPAAAALEKAEPQVMLTAGIHGAYDKGVAALADHAAVDTLARGAEGTGCTRGRAALFRTTAAAFLADKALGHEVFGAASIIVAAQGMDEIAEVLGSMEGQLTATLQLDDADVDAARPLLPLLERRAGRILANGWPTGVEVSPAMVHGGPFPATSDPRGTSVGTAAIERFLRPVCYQDLPDALLPRAVARGNPLGLPRLVDGEQA